MPVLEAPVHDKVKQGADSRYGCHNREGFSKGYWAPDRQYNADGTFKVVQAFIPHVMTTECRYDMSLTDHGCEGCTRRGDGEAYWDSYQRKLEEEAAMKS